MAVPVIVVVPGANGDMGHPFRVEPHHTAADVLAAAGLNSNEWVLHVKQGEELISLASDERVAGHVETGDKVYALSSQMVVSLAA